MKFPNLLTQTDHGLMLVNKGDRIVGRSLIDSGEWEMQYINVIGRRKRSEHSGGLVV